MSRRILISDIHGCFYSFRSLLEERVKFSKEDHLYLLGDYINKGPHSKLVLDYLMELEGSGYSLTILRGNHEQELLNVLSGSTPLDVFISKGGITFLRSFNCNRPEEIPQKYVDFILSMPFFIKLPDFFLVHAGFNFSMQNPFNETEELLNIRNYETDLNKTGGRKVIHGHSPTNTDKILQSLNSRENHFSIDAGCAYIHNPQQGKLLALEINSWQHYLQPNIDQSSNYST